MIEVPILNYLLPFVVVFVLTIILTMLSIKLAVRFHFVDQPDQVRKLHEKPTAYTGGLAIFFAFLLGVLLFSAEITRPYAGILWGSFLLVIVGFYDDMLGMKPWVKLSWQIAASGVAIVAGVGVSSITNPFGGVIFLNHPTYLFHIAGFGFAISPWADLLALVWIVAMINMLNFLDGTDGLATGVTGVAGVILFALSLLPFVNQFDSALVAIILTATMLGFLMFNFPPAKIFLGDSGSMFLGFLLATLAIVASGKIATVLLIFGLPLLDLVFVILRRVVLEHRNPMLADRKHFHHRLLDIGFGKQTVAFVFYVFSFLFGFLALFLHFAEKVWALAGLVVLVVIFLAIVVRCDRSKKI